MEEKTAAADNGLCRENSTVAADWAESMKEAMEEYIEEQGIYIRQ